jgi:hypothetical protein
MRLSFHTCTGRRAVVMGHDQQVRRRASPAAVRGAPRDTRCPIAVGAPVTQDWGSLVVRNMARRPRTATSPLVLDPESSLCPSIAENHGVDECQIQSLVRLVGRKINTLRGLCTIIAETDVQASVRAVVIFTIIAETDLHFP